jgi:hypothetical protein
MRCFAGHCDWFNWGIIAKNVLEALDEDRIFWRHEPKRCRNILVSILPAAVRLGCRPVGDRSCGLRRELDGKEQLIERGSIRRVIYGVRNLSVGEITGGRLFGRRLATFNHRSM